MGREAELISNGWRKRGTCDDPRLSEMAAAYEEIGLEVHIEPFDPEEADGCAGCMRKSPGAYKTIYTRKRQE